MSSNLLYNSGTILIQSTDKKVLDILQSISGVIYDKRAKGWRAHCQMYRLLISKLHHAKINYRDNIREYNVLNIPSVNFPSPYRYQTEALQVWSKSKWGIVVLPTGAGKSMLAGLCINQIRKSTLIVVPIIDLLFQWKNNLENIFINTEIGILGAGESNITDITVSTYDSARIHIQKLASRFCLVVFDECHHLPSPAYTDMARSLICPYRLGLTATPPEELERMDILRETVGDIVFSKEISELSGKFLSSYETKTIKVRLTSEEREVYDYHRGIYLQFKSNLPTWGFQDNQSWKNFVAFAGRTKSGRQALKSFFIQKQLAVAASEKFEELRKIVLRHRHEQILIFTNDNKTGFLISVTFFFPLITHESPLVERKKILDKFKSKECPFLVSSRVLNEGVDIPDAGVAVIISGTGTVREHVQRLGRILRKKSGKTAVLYEIITEDTSEIYTSQKRRMHDAYHQQ